MALITCEGVALGYDGTVVAEEINFSVEAGEYLCIVGENGSGKTTLMKALLKLKDPICGKITMGDGLKQTEIGYLPQQTQLQKDFPASVKEIVRSGCLNRSGLRPFYSTDDRRKATENMKKLGVLALQNRCYRELSGGQQQRVLLARALCATGKIILLDEPVAGLDPKATREMYELIAKLNREEGIAVIMILHDISAAATYATRVLHISHKPLFYGAKEEYLASDIGKAFLSAAQGDKE